MHGPDGDEAIDALLADALRLAGGADAEAMYVRRDSALTRFAGSHIHQNVSERDATVRLRVVDDCRTGVASTNRLDRAGLEEMARRALALSRQARRNPDAAPIPDASVGGSTSRIGYAPATAAATPEVRANGVRAVVEAAADSGLEAAGAFTTEASTLAVANSFGLHARQAATLAKLLTVVTGPDGASGYAQATSPDIVALDARAVGEEATDRAARSSGAVDLPPGDYTVILEEYAVATILEYLSFVSFSALAVAEGRSFMEIGARVMGSNVSIWDDGSDQTGQPFTIDYEGIAKRRVDLITDGVATAVVHDASTARRAGVAPTGHGLPAPNTFGPLAWNLFMAPGSSSKTAMLSAVERGVWVTRFHYVNIVQPRQAVLTGMTKDGTFLIEDGRMTKPIRNLRFTQSIPEAFERIAAISSDTRLVAAEYSGISARVPALQVDGFRFTGATTAESGA
jgi:PmbA protein